MSELYIGQKRSNLGCLLVVLIILGIGGAMGWWLGTRPPKAEPSAEAGTPTAAAPQDDAPQRLADARKLQSEDQLLEARDKAYEVRAASSNATVRASAEALLGEVNILLAGTPRAMPEKQDYRVQAGDSLDRLAKRFGTTVELIQKGNGLKGHIIREGDLLRILSGKFTVAADKTDNTLVLSLNDRFFKRYSCGTGQYGKTPVGGFIISDKIIKPPWWRPDGKLIPFGDTNNVLGTRWMALSAPDGAGPRGYGIHGTWEPDTIGKQASAGCIRLLNSDVEELFTLVPVGTPVAITDLFRRR